MKKLQSLIFTLIVVATGLVSCEKDVVSPIEVPVSQQTSTTPTDLFVPDGAATIIVDEVGTVMNVEGTYVVVSQGKTYLPNDLAEEFQAHKLKVFFVGKVRSSEINEPLIPIQLMKITGTDKPIELPDISSRFTVIDRITN